MIRIVFHIKNAIYSICWYLWNIAHLEAFFESKGIMNVRICLFHLWKPNAQYFSGNLISSNQKVFVKFGEKKLIQRENDAIQYLAHKLSSKTWLPTICDSDINGNFPSLIFDYIDGKSLNSFMSTKISSQLSETLPHILHEIVQSLGSIHVVHRDIRPHNIMVDPQNEIYLIDYAFLIDVSQNESALQEFPKTTEYLEKLQYLGNGYNPKSGEWDDAFSAHKILFECQVKSPFVKEIGEKIGKLSVQISGEN